MFFYFWEDPHTARKFINMDVSIRLLCHFFVDVDVKWFGPLDPSAKQTGVYFVASVEQSLDILRFGNGSQPAICSMVVVSNCINRTTIKIIAIVVNTKEMCFKLWTTVSNWLLLNSLIAVNSGGQWWSTPFFVLHLSTVFITYYPQWLTAIINSHLLIITCYNYSYPLITTQINSYWHVGSLKGVPPEW